MKSQHLKDAGWVAALISALVVGLVWTMSSPSVATTKFSTTHPAPTAARAYALSHGYDHTTVKAVIVHRTISGKLLSRKVYHSEAAAKRDLRKQLAVAKGGSSPGPGGCFGHYSGTITKTGRSTLGFALYHVKAYLQYGYDCLAHFVNVIDQSKDFGVDDHTWAWDGWVGAHTWSHAYAWQSGRPNSGWEKRATGEFHGPCISSSITCHEYPWAQIKAHADGSNTWDTGSM